MSVATKIPNGADLNKGWTARYVPAQTTGGWSGDWSYYSESTSPAYTVWTSPYGMTSTVDPSTLSQPQLMDLFNKSGGLTTLIANALQMNYPADPNNQFSSDSIDPRAAQIAQIMQSQMGSNYIPDLQTLNNITASAVQHQAQFNNWSSNDNASRIFMTNVAPANAELTTAWNNIKALPAVQAQMNAAEIKAPSGSLGSALSEMLGSVAAFLSSGPGMMISAFVGGALIGPALSAAMGSGLAVSAEELTTAAAADIAGGLVPEFGTNAAYDAALGSLGVDTAALANVTADMTIPEAVNTVTSEVATTFPIAPPDVIPSSLLDPITGLPVDAAYNAVTPTVIDAVTGQAIPETSLNGMTVGTQAEADALAQTGYTGTVTVDPSIAAPGQPVWEGQPPTAIETPIAPTDVGPPSDLANSANLPVDQNGVHFDPNKLTVNSNDVAQQFKAAGYSGDITVDPTAGDPYYQGQPPTTAPTPVVPDVTTTPNIPTPPTSTPVDPNTPVDPFGNPLPPTDVPPLDPTTTIPANPDVPVDPFGNPLPETTTPPLDPSTYSPPLGPAEQSLLDQIKHLPSSALKQLGIENKTALELADMVGSGLLTSAMVGAVQAVISPPVATVPGGTATQPGTYTPVPGQPLPPLQSGGVNPGWVNASPMYQTTSPSTSSYYWGNHPYAQTPADLANYNSIPNAPGAYNGAGPQAGINALPGLLQGWSVPNFINQYLPTNQPASGGNVPVGGPAAVPVAPVAP